MKKPHNTTMNTAITDEQLVDYLLKVLPDSEQQHLQQQIDGDTELQQRLNAWQNALFSFHADTVEKTPPKRVWQGIEQQLFDDNTSHATRRFWRWGKSIPSAAMAFCLLFGLVFWLQNLGYRPSPQSQYHASVSGLHFPITLWEVEGNRDSIVFTSIRDVSENGRECVAWLKQGDNAPVRLSAIPDTGNKMAYRIALPDNLTIKAGDRVIVAMVAHGDTHLPPIAEQHIVELNSI